MRLSPAEFDDKRARGKLRLALIGMSNIGKSYTAQRLEKANNFICYDVDAQIQAKIGNLGNLGMDAPNMQAMAKWMGHPYAEGYARKAAEYLALETELSLQASAHKGNLVLDTTGSVIHIAAAAQQSLENDYLIIYIKASPSDIKVLIDRYFKFPKPTIWGDHFRAVPGKTGRASLLACYPDLLKIRAHLYAALADITIEARNMAKTDMADTDILPLIRSHLQWG